ncbi:MAG: hypothetical protein ACYCYO_00375 [Bacilli bacterium]
MFVPGFDKDRSLHSRLHATDAVLFVTAFAVSEVLSNKGALGQPPDGAGEPSGYDGVWSGAGRVAGALDTK